MDELRCPYKYVHTRCTSSLRWPYKMYKYPEVSYQNSIWMRHLQMIHRHLRHLLLAWIQETCLRKAPMGRVVPAPQMYFCIRCGIDVRSLLLITFHFPASDDGTCGPISHVEACSSGSSRMLATTCLLPFSKGFRGVICKAVTVSGWAGLAFFQPAWKCLNEVLIFQAPLDTPNLYYKKTHM